MSQADVLSFIESPFTTKVEWQAYASLPPDKRAAALASARSGTTSAPPPAGGLLASIDFFKHEGGAPLLRRNSGFLTAEGLPDGWRARLDGWPALAGATDAAEEAEQGCEDEAALRIFLRDAERTFQNEDHRLKMIELLKRVWPENRDYHQGLGYVTSLFMLFFDNETTVRMLLRLTRDERYTPGYWKAAPDAYVRDAMVYGRLIEERFPQVATLLQNACVVPEAYASKWFIGLCVHVLPYAALLPFVEAYLEEGYLFLFKFAISLIETLQPQLLARKPSEVNIILELLRLDVCQFPDDTEDGAFFVRLVANARTVELEKAQVDALREEEGEKLRLKMIRAKEREAEMAAESDDEIVFSDEEDD